MAVSPTYPGVYIEEIPSGVHTIIGVPTSITAFIGRTAQGPANLGRTLTSFGDYERTFGFLDPAYPLSYSVADFFANGGTRAVIVRLFKDKGADAAKVAREVADAADASTGPQPTDVATAARTKANAVPAQPKPSKDAAEAVATAAEKAAAAPGATLATVKKAAQDSAAQFGDTSTATGRISDLLTLRALGPGTWGNDLYAKIDSQGITQEVADRFGLKQASLFNLTIYNNRKRLPLDKLVLAAPDERIQNLSIWKGAGSRRIDRVLMQFSNLVRFDGSFGDTEEASAFDKVSAVTPATSGSTGGSGTGTGSGTSGTGTGTGSTTPSPSDALKRFEGGADSLPLGEDLNLYNGSESEKSGLHALDDVDLFNLLCIPPDTRDGDTPPAVYQGAMKYCYERRAVLIVDPPKSWGNRAALISDPEGMLSGLALTGEEARNAALYYPRVTMPDIKRGGQIDTFAASGLIAGIIARTDARRGVWVAPAGVDASLGGAALEVNLTDRENGVLNPLGINCLRSFDVTGRVVWGARTLRGADQLADEYKYLPVRRTALFIEESLYRGTQWVVFKPNDEPLWAQIRLNVGAFMNDLFRKGAFQGGKPSDAYFVRCDGSTTTQNDIDRGIVNIVVGFAPLKPAEFVIVQIQQIAGRIQV